MQMQPALRQIISHLDVFEVEGHLAIFTVERSCFTFSLVMSVLLRAKDRGLAGLALYPLKFAATFMLSLKMEDRWIIITTCLPISCMCVFFLKNLKESQLCFMVLEHVCVLMCKLLVCFYINMIRPHCQSLSKQMFCTKCCNYQTHPYVKIWYKMCWRLKYGKTSFFFYATIYLIHLQRMTQQVKDKTVI